MGRRHSLRRSRRRRTGGRELERSTRPPVIHGDSDAVEEFEFIALVPTRVYEDDPFVAFQGNPPGAPLLLPVPCLGCGVRTDWVACRTDKDSDQFPLCEPCQDSPGMLEEIEAEGQSNS
jgi:hypothetical protein